ncbi:hypothetical protein KCP71_08680 [Salmonella enterica subsp. enterica]|nr:hypothetical protein KCP71_08680 [Salmonella enterica subsp. enterica]
MDSKLIRDTSERGHSREAVMDSVVHYGRLHQLHYAAVLRTHINFQRVPTVDTSIRSPQDYSLAG